MIFVTFITNELLDNLITASRVFVVVMLFEALRFSSTLYFPMAVEKVSEAVVSIRRIKVWGQVIVVSCRWIFCKMLFCLVSLCSGQVIYNSLSAKPGSLPRML